MNEVDHSELSNGRLRHFPIMIWMSADTDILEQRIEKRIDQMVETGGLLETFEVFKS